MSYSVQPSDYRTRVAIFSNSVFKDNVFNLDNCTLNVFSYIDTELGSNYIIEAYCRSKNFTEINNAHSFSVNKIQEFLDQLSLISFFPVHIISELSTTSFKVELNKEFKMIIPNCYLPENNPVEISRSDFKLSEISNEKYNQAIRQAREGLGSHLDEYKFLHFYSALERIAEANTTERILTKCKNCGDQEDRGPATSNFIRQLFQATGISKIIYERIRKLRGKLAHGSNNRGIKFMDEIRYLLPILEKICITEVANYSNLSLKKTIRPHLSNQFLLVNAIKIKERTKKRPSVFKILNYSYSVNVSFNMIEIKTNESQEGFLTPHIPLEDSLDIHRECWPY